MSRTVPCKIPVDLLGRRPSSFFYNLSALRSRLIGRGHSLGFVFLSYVFLSNSSIKNSVCSIYTRAYWYRIGNGVTNIN